MWTQVISLKVKSGKSSSFTIKITLYIVVPLKQPCFRNQVIQFKVSLVLVSEQGPSVCSTCEGRVPQTETIEGWEGTMRESHWKGNGWGAGAQTTEERETMRKGGWQRGQWSGLVCVFIRLCVSACVCICEGTRSRPSLHTLLPHYWQAELIPQQWASAPTDVTATKRPPDIFTHAP